MITDLQDAIAAVDWATSQLPTLQERIISWRRSKPYSVFIDADSEPGKKLYRLIDLKPIDPIISAEAGAIIHSIRSSLDLLACALAARNGFPQSRSTHFPIWKSDSEFLNLKSRPYEYIKRLSQVDRDIITDLRPFPGGNDLLCALHELDLTRKHRRLLKTVVTPRGMNFAGLGGEVTTYDWPTFDEDALLVSTPASAADGEVTVNLQVALNEAGVSRGEDCAGSIRNLARATFDIIIRFA